MYTCSIKKVNMNPEKGDPDNSIKPGTLFKNLTDDWKCPECGVDKEQIEEVTE